MIQILYITYIPVQASFTSFNKFYQILQAHLKKNKMKIASKIYNLYRERLDPLLNHP